MKSNRLGCFTPIAIISALITLAAIAGIVYARGNGMFSPGPLNAEAGRTVGGFSSHAETGGECGLCHTAPWDERTMADRCKDCHEDLASDMAKIAKAHGEMNHDNPELSCMHCHPEHLGAAAPLTLESARAEFPHDVTEYSLNGHALTEAQAPFVCEDCHEQELTSFETAACVDCHRGLDAAFTESHLAWGTDCLNCHDGVDTYNKHFDHGKAPFTLEGAHVDVDCYSCHAAAKALADLKSAPRNCMGCHQTDEPHELRFGADCLTCHTMAAWTPSTFDHNASAFLLDGAHVDVDCETCHETAPSTEIVRACADCHLEDDAHEGMFTLACGACHKTTAWDDSPFSHNNSKFPLTGGHAGVECSRCHKDMVFEGTTTSCVGCHGYPGWHGPAFGANCLECHTVNNWRARYTGGHPWYQHPKEDDFNGMGGCRSCHPASVYETDCDTCHREHEGGEGGGEED
jgi:hypothetical protein